MSAPLDPLVTRQRAGKEAEPPLRRLDPDSLSDHSDALYRVARTLCESREDAEDLVQDTFVGMLRRPRWLRDDNARAYLFRALRNNHATQYRAAVRRPKTVPLPEDDFAEQHCDPAASDAGELLAAILSAPRLYRDAVLAVDVLGLSYRQAAQRLRTRETTITTRLHRGRRHVQAQIQLTSTSPMS